MKEQYDIEKPSVQGFRDFVGKSIFTVEFFKAPKTKAEKLLGLGEYRKMNCMLGVSKYVKGTAQEATAKRNETNTERLQIGCYEMRGTSVRIEEENYRTLPISPDRLISISANGVKIRNPRLSQAAVDAQTDAALGLDFELREDGTAVLDGRELTKAEVWIGSAT